MITSSDPTVTYSDLQCPTVTYRDTKVTYIDPTHLLLPLGINFLIVQPDL